jgi:hypothetical protein
MTKEQTIINLREWVLWSLAGQPVVRSSQLAAMAASALRRCSPLGYLRWVTLGKELSVSEIYEEAIGLLSVPSVPLEFIPDAAPRLHAERLPGPASGFANSGDKTSTA